MKVLNFQDSGFLPDAVKLRQKPASLKRRPGGFLSPTSRLPADGLVQQVRIRTGPVTEGLWANQPSFFKLTSSKLGEEDF